jgi:hypothetical protein
MGYVIGTEEGYSTWGQLRGPLFNPATNDIVGWPQGAVYLLHNKYFPTGSASFYPPAFFISQSGTMLRRLHFFGGWYIHYPQFNDPSNPGYWEGFMFWGGMDKRDFDEMVGSSLDFSPGVVTLAEEAYTTGQYINDYYTFNFGIQTIQKLKVLT